MKIYFAGPLFTPYERDFISKCAMVLRKEGYDVFVPHESSTMTADPDDKRTIQKKCFDNDFGAISKANAIVAILNGTEVDDGTATEIGIFHSLMKADPTKKGVVCLHDDYRSGLDGEGKPLNAFVAGCILEIGKIVANVEETLPVLAEWRRELGEREA